MTTKRLLAVSVPVALGLVLLVAQPGFSWLSQFTRGSGGTVGRNRWTSVPTFQVNTAIGGNISGSRTVSEVITASFATWTTAPNTGVAANRGPDTASTNVGKDGVNLICFVCSNADFSSAGTLAVTETWTNTGGSNAGQIVEADITFNPAHNFSTDGAGNGTDLQSVATHEIGHFFGLDHSAVTRAVMYPYAEGLLRTLSYDDDAAIASVYPGQQSVPTGSISGHVRFNAGNGVFGAHVFADSTTAGAAFPGLRKSPIATLSAPDGSYTISGVPADTYVITAEPLDGPVTNSDVSGYGPAYATGSVLTNFTTRQH